MTRDEVEVEGEEPRVPILLVDDHPANLVALEAILEPLNLDVVRANSGEEALKQLLRGRFAAILLDVQMPGLDGFQTAALIKARKLTEHVPLVFITAIQRETEHIFHGYDLGAVDYMCKPFNPEILRSKVRVFVDLYRREQEIRRQASALRIKERVAAERERERRFRDLVDSLPVALFATTADGRAYYRNRAWTEYTGLDGGDRSPSSWLHLLHPDDAPGVKTVWEGALTEGNPIETQFRLRRQSDGEFRWHLGRVVPERDEQGAVVGWIATATDIHAQKCAEDAAEEGRRAAEIANAMKDEFLATLSHELRTPLTAILGWAEMLRSGRLTPDKATRAIDTIERNARTQIDLIEDILDVARITAGKLRIEMKPVDIFALVDDAIDSVRPSAESKKITLTVERGRAPVACAGDPDRLQQIIWNLLTNAVKFTPEGGQVHALVELQGTTTVIRVRDTGVGIRASFLPYVFDRFRQENAGSTRAHGGLGLGLSLVRHLVELHGGTVRAQSPGEGQGATFTIELPSHVESPTEDAEDEAADEVVRGRSNGGGNGHAHPVLTGLRVLLVEDEPDLRELVAELLEEQGADVTAVGTCEAAMNALEGHTTHVLLSDIGLPDHDGFELIRRVRALQPDRGGLIPAAALTAYTGSEYRQRVVDAGFQRFIPKPIDPTALTRAVADLANGRAEGALAEPTGRA